MSKFQIPCKKCVVLARCMPKKEIKCELLANFIVDAKKNKIRFKIAKRTIRKVLPNIGLIWTSEERQIDDFLLRLSLGPYGSEESYLKYKEVKGWTTRVKIV